MIWQSYESQGVALLNEPMAEQLSEYLEKKESQLSAHVIDLVLLFESIPSMSEITASSPMRLSEAVEELGRKVRQAVQAPRQVLTSNQWKIATKQLNDALWNYVEVLEGCVTELFQQIDQIGFEQWTIDLVRAATSMKDELTHRMDDLIWAIRRLEQQLKCYWQNCEKKEGKWVVWTKIFSWGSLLDRSLESHVRKCNKFLNFRYRKFVERYTGYLQLFEKAQQPLHKFYDHRVLSSLDLDQQDKFKQLYLLLRLWELDQHARVLPKGEPIRALRSCISTDWAFSLFQDYFSSIHKAVFDKSRMIKKQFRHVFIDKQTKQPVLDNIAGYRKEMKLLGETISKYRKFHLQTDPEARHWFRRLFKPSRRPEAKQLKDLQRLNQEIKSLDSIAVHFQSSLEREPSSEKKLTPQFQNEVSHYLHEMTQPLASQNLMRRNGKALLSSLQSLDEMGTFDPHVVEFVSRTLCKAMCSDWKYHVLQEIPLFHRLYDVHRNLTAGSEDRQHMNRLNKFRRILEQLKLWIDQDETLRRAHEIELDINDLKAYLQDFLAYVQRLEKKPKEVSEEEEDSHPVTRATQALLQYLYVFGSFLHTLHPNDPEHRLIRKQLLFIDQYFEEVERKIQELNF